MSLEDLMIGRIVCELRETARIGLGPGLPMRVVPFLSPHQKWLDLGQPRGQGDAVDLAVVEALEVSESGGALVAKGAAVERIDAGTWIVAGMLKVENGGLQMVKECTLPDQCGGVSLIVTELGVIGVSEIGFELLEISPGVCSDDVRMQVHASLHVADDVRRIQLCA